MKNKRILVTGIFLVVTIGNYFKTISDGSVRTVEFLTIFAIGALFGILIMQIAQEIKDKKQQKNLQ